MKIDFESELAENEAKLVKRDVGQREYVWDVERAHSELTAGDVRGAAWRLNSLGWLCFGSIACRDLWNKMGVESLAKCIFYRLSCHNVISLGFPAFVRNDLDEVRGEKKLPWLFHALITLRRWKDAYQLGKLFYEENRRDSPFGDGYDYPIFGHTLKLIAVLGGESPSVSAAEVKRFGLGVYEQMYDAWDDVDALKQVIAKCCDYHWKQVVSEEMWVRDHPSRLIPFEVLSVVRVRERMGLETELPNHDLLDSPLVKNLPRELPVIEDELLHKVIDAANEKYAEYGQIDYPSEDQEVDWVIDFGKRQPFMPKGGVGSRDFDEVLLKGKRSEIVQVMMEDDHALVVDWKAAASEVLNEVERLVPEFEWSGSGDDHFVVKFAGREHALSISYGNRQDEGIFVFTKEIAEFLKPDWEMRIYRLTQWSDTSVYIIRPREFWKRFSWGARVPNRLLFGKV